LHPKLSYKNNFITVYSNSFLSTTYSC